MKIEVAQASKLFVRLSRHFRSRRMQHFSKLCKAHSGLRVLDVGGNPAIWLLLPELDRPHVIYLNMPRAAEPGDDRRNLVFANGTRLPFPDQSFDLVFSNSVIEHVGGFHAQQQLAAEIARVGRNYWVQTPNRYFPVEQHLMTPFVHWLPKSIQSWLVRNATVWAFVTNAEPQERQFYLEHFLRDVRLLDCASMKELFPGATIHRERFLGWTKSLIAAKLGPSKSL